MKGALADLQLLILLAQLPAQALGFRLLFPLPLGEVYNAAGNFFQFLLVSFVLSPLLLLAALS